MRDYSGNKRQDLRPEVISARTTNSAIAWMLAGIGIGAAVALLFTPTNGRYLRSSIANGCRRTISGISRGTKELRERGSNLLSFTRSREQRSQQG
jgi:gas vesicle protein